MISFFDIVQTYFSFLISDYGYKVAIHNYYPDHFGNWIIGFASEMVGLKIVLDRNEVFIYIGRKNDIEDNWFDICDVITYFEPQINSVYIFPDTTSIEESRKFQVKRLSELIKTYCSSILLGDFSMEKGIINANLTRQKATIEKYRKINPNFDGK